MSLQDMLNQTSNVVRKDVIYCGVTVIAFIELIGEVELAKLTPSMGLGSTMIMEK